MTRGDVARMELGLNRGERDKYGCVLGIFIARNYVDFFAILALNSRAIREGK